MLFSSLHHQHRHYRQHYRLFSVSVKSFDPELIVEALDKHIIGQNDAKRAVAVAFRNRYRRRRLPEDLQKEIMPANILMKGPTGCGKTEIARRIASLAQAPFVKVEATRYTEVGIVGANTNTMIKDLLDIAIAQEREQAIERTRVKATLEAEKHVLSLLGLDYNEENLTQLRNGDLDLAIVDLPEDVLQSNRSYSAPVGDSSDDNMSGGIPQDLGRFLSRFIVAGKRSDKSGTSKLPVKEALKQLSLYYSNQAVDQNEVIAKAKVKTEQEGIVFVDEIDKLAASDRGSGMARNESLKEGVQKELLSILEGCTVSTKHGPISTNHILFIASGAFHQSHISDLLPELQGQPPLLFRLHMFRIINTHLQIKMLTETFILFVLLGRLPVRVELKSLTQVDLQRILSEKKYNLVAEVQALMSTEDVKVEFTEDGIEEIARFAYMLNTTKGNIGARRLTAVMHTVMEEISFMAHRLSGSTKVIDKNYVATRMKGADPTSEENLSKYIL